MPLAEHSARGLPSVERLLRHPSLAISLATLPRSVVVGAAREVLGEARAAALAGDAPPPLDALVQIVASRAAESDVPSLRRVINATGVVIHTNLGRVPLSDDALAMVSAVSSGYSNLELELSTGERGSRHSHVADLLREVTGAEDGIAVNNNASAVLLCLAALATGREVIVSRGQAVEIGGGFRIPDVLRQSGCALVEVGTTNRTYLIDYEAAVTPATALLLHVHPSNFRVTGFAHSVSGPELAVLGQRLGVRVLDDVGSGALLDTSAFGLAKEPTVQESVAAGCDLVCFSGDKLLGGPQAGLIVGRQSAVELVRRHPLARAVRIDKASLAGLSATLRHYARGEAVAKVPVWRMIAAGVESLRARAEAWAASACRLGLAASTISTRSAIGGGSLPGETLPTVALAISPRDDGSVSASVRSVDDLAELLRRGRPPIVGRVDRGALLLDPRTVQPGEDGDLLSALEAALAR